MRSNENGTVLERQFLLRGLFGEIFSGRAHCLIGSAASTGSWVATTPRVASVKKKTTDLPRPGGRARLHVRHLTATVTVAFAEPPGCNDDGDTKYETCGGKAVQDRVSSRAFLRLCPVIAANYKTNEARWLRVPTTKSKNGPRRDEWAARRNPKVPAATQVIDGTF